MGSSSFKSLVLQSGLFSAPFLNLSALYFSFNSVENTVQLLADGKTFVQAVFWILVLWNSFFSSLLQYCTPVLFTEVWIDSRKGSSVFSAVEACRVVGVFSLLKGITR